MENTIVFGYDILTFNGPIPNCFPNEYLLTIKEASNYDFSSSGDYFQQKHNQFWPLYNSNFYDYSNHLKIKSVFDIKRERLKNSNNQKWFYIIEPFGSIDPFFGNLEDFSDSLINNIPKETLQEIRNGNGNILINYIIDGGLGIRKENFLKLKEFFIKNKIADEKVYLIFQDFKLVDSLKTINVNYNFLNFNLALLSKSQEFYNTINNPTFSYWGKGMSEPQVGKIEAKKSSIQTIEIFKQNLQSLNVENQNDEMQNLKKDFLFFCRHVRLERLLILDFLYKKGEDKNFYSWSKKFMNETINVVQDFDDITANSELKNKFLNEDKILDVPDLSKIAGYGFEDSTLYQNSFLSIVGETIFFQNDDHFKTGYLSEKIWKPIGHCHPFILVGPSNSLKYLRDLGFKTFSPFIDESYDCIENEEERLLKILEVLESFSNLSYKDKCQFLINVSEIIEHNYNHFLSFQKNESDYRKAYIDYLLCNNKKII